MATNTTTNSTSVKARHWACLVYEDSAPSDWRERLEGLLVPAFISPLHDKDVKDDGSGELKKPHYHVILSFRNTTTLNNVKRLAESFGAANGQVQAVHDLSGHARYLCHLSSDNKTKYSIADVCQLNGADYMEVIQTNTDRLEAFREMQRWCDDNEVFSFAELCRYARDNRSDWYRVLVTSNGTTTMVQYVQSLKWEHEQGLRA